MLKSIISADNTIIFRHGVISIISLYNFAENHTCIMIRHIVFLKVTETAEGERMDLLHQAKSRLLCLPGQIPLIRRFEAGINETPDAKAADLVLISEFDDYEALNAYLVHPAHQEFVEWNRNKCPKSAVVDYTITN